MKKVFLILAIAGLLSGSAYSADCSYTCSEPYDLSNGTSRFLSTVTGSKFLGEQVAKVILKKEILKNTDGKFKVNVSSYSVKDLKKGIFKSITISGQNLESDDIYFSALDIKTLCDFNYISMENPNKPVFKEDLPLAFTAVLSEDDLNKTMKSIGYKRILESVNMFFKIHSTSVKIRDNRLYYVLKTELPFIKGIQNIVLTTDLKVVNGKVDFTNTRLINDMIAIDLRKIDKLINYINPLDFSLNILENKDANMTVQNIKIADNKIIADGYMVIPKD